MLAFLLVTLPSPWSLGFTSLTMFLFLTSIISSGNADGKTTQIVCFRPRDADLVCFDDVTADLDSDSSTLDQLSLESLLLCDVMLCCDT